MTDPNFFIVAIVLAVLILMTGMVFIKRVIGGFDGGNRLNRIPPPRIFLHPYDACYAVMQDVFGKQAIDGCRWRLTYYKSNEGRIQARVYGKPASGTGSEKIDILMNMLLHKLEPQKTELEWSYVVMGGDPKDADDFIAACNRLIDERLGS